MINLKQTIQSILKKQGFLAFIYFFALTIIMTYPLILHMQTRIIGGTGDNVYYIWLFDWYQHALFKLHTLPFFTPFLNYPEGMSITITETTPSMVAIGLPFTELFGSVWSYNFSMIASFIMAGLGMFAWVRHLTHDTWAGYIAGTIFAFLPYHFAHFVIGHLPLIGIQWFPFYFWGLFDLLQQKKFSWKPVIMAVISITLIAMTSMYYIYMCIIISIIFGILYLLLGELRRVREASFWKSILTFSFIGGILVGLVLLPYIQIAREGGLINRSVEYVSEYSASLTDFFAPSRFNFLWGEWARNHLSQDYWQESNLAIGYVSIILLIIAWVKKKELPQIGNLLWISSLTAFTALILALGINLHWLGNEVPGLTNFHLPDYYLNIYLPFFSKMRVMMRFGIFVLTFTSMMAGLGSYTILKKKPLRTKNLISILILLLIFIEFYPGDFSNWTSDIHGRPVDYWLAEQTGTGSVAEFPFSQVSEQYHIYYSEIYDKPFIGGFFSVNTTHQYEEIAPIMNSFPSIESISMLRDLGVTYVVVDSSLYEDFELVNHEALEHGLVLIHISENEYVYSWP